MAENISRKSVVTSLIYKSIEKIGVKFVGFIISVILARLIDPEIFGVLAILMSIVTIMQVFVESGLNIALIQNKTTQENDYSTVLYLSLGFAAIIYLLLFFLTPLVLDFFNMPGYDKHLRVLLIILFFYSFNSIQIAYLTRQMKFRSMLVCQMISTCISGLVAVIAAFSGLGIWALIIHYLGNSIIACFTYSFISKWKPRLVFSFERAKVFFGFGVKTLASSIVTSLFFNIRTFAVGKMFTKTDLAYYTRGDQVPNIVSSTVDSVFKSVMLPVYSRSQDNKDDLLRLVRRTVQLNSYINFPAMFGLSAIAPSMVLLLYTSKWADCIPFVQILSLSCLSLSICSPCLVSIQAMGKIDWYVKLEIVRRIVMTAILVISLFTGNLIYIAIGWLVSNVWDVFIVTLFSRKLLGYTFKMMFSDVFPCLIGSVLMYMCLLLLAKLDLAAIIMLVLQILTGTAVYVLYSALFRLDSFTYLKDMVLKGIYRI